MPRKKDDDISDKQREVYLYIIHHVEQFGFQPSHREIAEHFGVTKRAISQRLNLLAEKGWVDLSDGNRERAVVLRHVKFRARLSRQVGGSG